MCFFWRTMTYVTTEQVRLAITVPSSIVSDLAIQQYITWAERDVDRETFTTYWQTQVTGTVTSATSTTLTTSTASWTENQFVDCFIKLTGGTGSGQLRGILSGNTPTSLTVDRAWTVTPDATTTYTIYYSGTNPYFSQSVDGNNMSWYYAPNYPIQVIESLVINSTTVTPAYVLTYESGKMYLGSSAEYRYFDNKSPQLVALKYWWGVLGVPREVERYTCLLAATQCLNNLLSSVYNTPISYNMPEGSVAIKPPADSIKQTIAQYRDEMAELSKHLIRYQSLG
jgi:hypothetical protein